MKVVNRKGEVVDFEPFGTNTEPFDGIVFAKSGTSELGNVDPAVAKAIEQNATTKIQLKG